MLLLCSWSSVVCILLLLLLLSSELRRTFKCGWLWCWRRWLVVVGSTGGCCEYPFLLNIYNKNIKNYNWYIHLLSSYSIDLQVIATKNVTKWNSCFESKNEKYNYAEFACTELNWKNRFNVELKCSFKNLELNLFFYKVHGKRQSW